MNEGAPCPIPGTEDISEINIAIFITSPKVKTFVFIFHNLDVESHLFSLINY